ncbi:MAG: phosphate ABC transporter substrate-binding protein PstS family protein [Armatimonadetes bacterium]|nr:phosphate ABC transporter substrate-binding protein PstS family protein [Armatimonadota bacterium]
MRTRQRSVLLVAAALVLLFSQFAFAQEAPAQDISVLVNGQRLSLDTPPLLEQGRVLVPMRAIFEAIGATVDWDGQTRTVTGRKGDVEVILKIGDVNARVSGRNVTLDVAAKVVNDRTLVPLRFVSESLGAAVDWNGAAGQVVVNTAVTGGGELPATLSGTLKMSGSTSVQPLAEELAQAFRQKYPQVQITITGGGSGVGIKDAAAGKVNIGNASRALKDSDPKGIVGTTIAKDAVVVVVHPNNPVNALTKQQVKDIYTGKITNWQAVGGPDAPIIVNSRTAPSGTFDFFTEEFLDNEKVVATAKQHASNGLVRQAVAANENAIGFISMGYLDNTVKAPLMDGVTPSMENAKNGTYHFVRPFNMVTNGEPTGLARAFLEFVLSAEGQAIVGKEYIPVK